MPTRFKWFSSFLISGFTVAGLIMISHQTPLAAQSGLVEVVPSKPIAPPVTPGKSPWDGGAKLAAAFLGWLSDQAVKMRIESKLSELREQIDTAMPRSGGVLVVVGIQQSAQPDGNGHYIRSVLDGYVAGTGASPKSAMDAYLAQDRLEEGVPRGFVRRNLYFWKPATGTSSKGSK